MIEFLPPRDDAFGERDAADFVGVDGDDAVWGDEPPRSRWLTALAVVGVTGLLAGGVIAAAPWDGSNATPPSTTTTPTTTEPRRPTTTAPTEPTLPQGWPTSPPGWIPEDGSSYRVVYAFSSGDGPFPDIRLGGSSTAVFAAADDQGRTSVGRTTGRWLAVESGPVGMSYQTLRRGAVVTTAGDRQVLVSTAADGVVTVDVEVFPGTGEAAVRVSGYDVGLDTLLAVASTVDLAWSGNVRELDLGAATASGALDGLELLVPPSPMGWAADGELGAQLASTDVADGASGRWGRVALLRQDARERQVSELLARSPVDAAGLPLEVQRRLDELAMRGLPLTLSRSTDGGLVTARVQLVDDTVLAVTGDGTVAQLIDLVESLRPADDTEWLDLLVKSANALLDSPAPPAPEGAEVGSGTAWGASIANGRFSLGTASGGAWERFEHGQGPELVEYRSLDEAFLRATTTFPDVARYVEVSQDGSEPQQRKLVEIPRTGVLAIVVELDPALPYTVRWLDADFAPLEGPADASASASSPPSAPAPSAPAPSAPAPSATP